MTEIKKDSKVYSSKLSDQHNSSFSKGYLLSYNVFQFLGWIVILIQTLHHLIVNGGKVKGLWDVTNICLKIFQTLALLEVIHAAVGIVRSGVVTTFIQIISRIIVVWPICSYFKASQETFGLPLILIAWSITEIIRYSFYFLNIVNQAPAILVYLRYTLFIILYPMGVLGEQWCIISSMPEVYNRRTFSITMPNKFNFTFDFYYFCIIFLLLYIPFFPQLYQHMFAQRRKVLNKNKEDPVKHQKKTD